MWIIPTKDLSFGTMIDRLLVYAPAISADPTQQESLKELRQGRSMGGGMVYYRLVSKETPE